MISIRVINMLRSFSNLSPSSSLPLSTPSISPISNTQELCEDYEAVLPNGDESTPICAWDHDGAKGLKYQILAGPVFNNLYPLAGILMGILADRFNRKILLGLSLLVWSLAIGATGFAVSYVMLLIFRMLLALG